MKTLCNKKRWLRRWSQWVIAERNVPCHRMTKLNCTNTRQWIYTSWQLVVMVNSKEKNKDNKCRDDSHSSAKLQKLSQLCRLFIHNSHTKHTVLDLFNVCSNHALINSSGQESKNNLHFMILTYLWAWNKVKITKPGMNW